MLIERRTKLKEVSSIKKMKVIKLFISGLSYDDISQQVGVAKGSVVNIVTEFREGTLPVPPDMIEYVDVLRQVAVDLRKNDTTFAQVQPCVKISAKLREMRVSSNEVEQWLDIPVIPYRAERSLENIDLVAGTAFRAFHKFHVIALLIGQRNNAFGRAVARGRCF